MPYLMAGFPDIGDERPRSATAHRRGRLRRPRRRARRAPSATRWPTAPSYAAATAALDSGATVHNVLEVGTRLAELLPVVLMVYVNPILARGLQRFAAELAERGISGLIVPDLPLEESEPVLAACDAHGMALVPLVAPTTRTTA